MQAIWRRISSRTKAAELVFRRTVEHFVEARLLTETEIWERCTWISERARWLNGENTIVVDYSVYSSQESTNCGMVDARCSIIHHVYSDTLPDREFITVEIWEHSISLGSLRTYLSVYCDIKGTERNPVHESFVRPFPVWPALVLSFVSWLFLPFLHKTRENQAWAQAR